jgi:mono/diheme cytochrome c family protein
MPQTDRGCPCRATFAPMIWKAFGVILCGLMLAGCGATTDKHVETKREISGAKSGNDAGKKLFYTKCASCHMVNKELSGPALRGVLNRWPDKQKLYAFIRNSEEVINSDQYARELWLRYNQTMMNKNEDLTDEDISNILEYIESVSEPAG